MVESLENIIKHLGTSNVVAITLFLISIFFAFYLYFRTFYRLVYSTGRIYKGYNKIFEKINSKTEFVTRILFYNNGRKTITRKTIQKLELTSSNKIDSVKIIKGLETINTTKIENTLKIDIEYLNSSEYFVLEIKHSGDLYVNGRISETGDLLHTEPKYWVILNIVFTIFFFAIMFYHSITLLINEEPQMSKFLVDLFILFGVLGVIQFIHSILFIPDSLSNKYLGTKDRFANEFKSQE